MKQNTLITTYKNPDIDGVASCLAYSKILENQEKNSEVLFWGKPQPEVDFILKKFNLSLPFYGETNNPDWNEIVVLDTSSTKRLSEIVDSNKVTEIIDHHPSEDGKEFDHATIQNEEVGATATLVVEKLRTNNITIPNNLGIFLYVAIHHNTLNMLIGVTERDKAAATFLVDNYKIDQNLIDEMFKYVVSYTLTNLKSVLESDFKEFEVRDRKYIGGQVLFYDAKPCLNSLLETVKNINVLTTTPYFVKADDLKFNKTFLYCSDNLLQKIIIEKFKVVFNDNWAELSPIILRKRMIKALSEK